MEIRSSNAVNIPQIRDRLSTLGLGEVTIQEFGKETDALVRIQRQDGAEKEQMAAINKVKDRLGSEFEYRRTEFVGPTVGKELKEAGIIAICLALLSILIKIWLRIEWQFINEDIWVWVEFNAQMLMAAQRIDNVIQNTVFSVQTNAFTIQTAHISIQ